MSALLFGTFALSSGRLRAEQLDELHSLIPVADAAAGRRWSDGGAGLWSHGALGASPSGRYRVAMTGQLHDREALLKMLGGEVADPSQVSCAAWVARAWERWGRQALQRLQGEFSLAVIDTLERRLTLAQSRVETGPLYYAETPHRIVFSTQARLLTRLPDVGCTLDETGFARALSQYVIQAAELTRTCFQQVRKLPAAWALEVGQGAREEGSYWEPDRDAATEYRSEPEVHGRIREYLQAAVSERVRGHQRVACMLSGGLDSSTLACLAVQALGAKRVVAVSSVLPRKPTRADAPDERPHIEAVCRHLNLELCEVTPAQEPGPWKYSDAFFDATEIPLASPRHYLYQALFEAAAAQGATVLLDGSYGELGPSFPVRPRPWDRLVRGPWSWRAASQRVRAKWAAMSGDHLEQVRETSGLPRYAPWLLGKLREDFLRDSGLLKEMQAGSGPALWIPRGERIGYPPDWRKVARNWPHSAAEVVVQYPFRDLRLWTYCAGLPQRLAWRSGYSRYLLRAAMAGVLPKSIQWRTTKGPFSPDYYARLHQGVGWALELCASVSPEESAARMIDLPWLRSELYSLSHGSALNVRLAFLLQGSVMAIQFLRWFEKRAKSSS